MSKRSEAYNRLASRFHRMAVLEEASSLLGWDASAMMPSGGGGARGEQLAVLAGLTHSMLVASEMADDLGEAEHYGLGDRGVGDETEADAQWFATNLALMRHAHKRATALPGDLVEAQARSNSKCEMIWRGARQTSDFQLVLPHLDDVIALARQQADALSPALGLSPYDGLMDGFQRGFGADDISPIFSAYRHFLKENLPLAEEIQASRPKPSRPLGPFDTDLQEALCRRLSERAGLEPDHSRLDRSTHPFCGGTPTDVRITTRYDVNDFSKSLLGVMHETGHGLYERGLPTQWSRQPVGCAAGMGVHESQSLIIEMQVCRSDAFLTWLSPELHAMFGGDAALYQPKNLGHIWRSIERGFIRVEADEMTYPAHVIMRFELEKALIAGDLLPKDLPSAWNDKIKDLLGITPPDHTRGVLQDIHWYTGLFGYFPSYTLGAMAAAQLMAAAKGALPDLDQTFANGDFKPLLGWLRTHVHAKGSLLGFNDLLKSATGKPLDVQFFEAHLTRRYLTA